jgi:hypothetical protein
MASSSSDPTLKSPHRVDHLFIHPTFESTCEFRQGPVSDLLSIFDDAEPLSNHRLHLPRNWSRRRALLAAGTSLPQRELDGPGDVSPRQSLPPWLRPHQRRGRWWREDRWQGGQEEWRQWHAGQGGELRLGRSGVAAGSGRRFRSANRRAIGVERRRPRLRRCLKAWGPRRGADVDEGGRCEQCKRRCSASR